MLPFVIVGALAGIALTHRMDPGSQIEENFKKVMDPTLPPRERQKAYQLAMRIDGSKYDGESFADVDKHEVHSRRHREEIFYACRHKEQYQSVLAKVDKALENGAISREQHQALSKQYNGAIKSIDDWLNK